MNCLLDTHIILWWLNDDAKLTDIHRNIIGNPSNICYFSAASIWEISIKRILGKLEINHGYINELRDEGFLELPVNSNHADKVKDLPLIHRDPFDRLLISQSVNEKLTLLTCDEYIQQYEVEWR